MSEFGSFSGAMKGISAGANNFNSSFQNGGVAGSPSVGNTQQSDLDKSIEEIMKRIKAKEASDSVTPRNTVIDYDSENPFR